VIPFIQKTWFLWWILATLFILRWFHLFSSDPDEGSLEVPESGEGKAVTASNQNTLGNREPFTSHGTRVES